TPTETVWPGANSLLRARPSAEVRDYESAWLPTASSGWTALSYRARLETDRGIDRAQHDCRHERQPRWLRLACHRDVPRQVRRPHRGWDVLAKARRYPARRVDDQARRRQEELRP